MKKIINLLSWILLVCLLCSATVYVGAETENSTYSTGYISDDLSWFSNHIVSSNVPAESQLPASCDNSTSPYFPAIGDQARSNSCASFATTYYQFTYEANKLNNIVTTPDNTYFPMWTYNFCRYPNDGGSTFEDNYNVLTKWGALRYSDYDNIPSTLTSSYTYWSDNTEAKIEALNTRISTVNTIHTPMNGSGIMISFEPGTSDTHAFDAVKHILSSGKILTVSSISSGWVYKTTTNGETAIIQNNSNAGGHAITIVGYNDNIKCDINGNGTIESNEKGAFKIANSWGSGYQNNGFVWVMYDAFNDYNQSGRRSFLRYEYFTYITVANMDVGCIGQLTFSTNRRYQISAFSAVEETTTTSTSSWLSKVPLSFSSNDAISYTGSFIFDLQEAYYKVMDNNWFIQVKDKSNDGNAIYNISYKIIDNKNNTIKNFGLISTGVDGNSVQTYQNLNFPKGDLDYSGGLNNKDYARLKKYLADPEGMNFSNIQCYLADMNNDNYINNKDLSALKTALAEG